MVEVEAEGFGLGRAARTGSPFGTVAGCPLLDETPWYRYEGRRRERTGGEEQRSGCRRGE